MPVGRLNAFDDHVVESVTIVHVGIIARFGNQIVRVMLRGHAGCFYVAQIEYIILIDPLVGRVLF